MARFAITDIHGCLKTFRNLLEDKLQVSKRDSVYLLGDYVDRGPDSKGVLDYIMNLQKKGYKIEGLRGNHEDMMVKSLFGEGQKQHWFRNGGRATMASFKVENPKDIQPRYFDFIDSLNYFFELDDYLLVHAGFNFKNENIFEDKEYMLWTRNHRPKKEMLGGKKVVHGHTPITQLTLSRQFKNGQTLDINLDNGCVYQNDGYNHLVALNLDNLELTFQENIDLE